MLWWCVSDGRWETINGGGWWWRRFEVGGRAKGGGETERIMTYIVVISQD
jgi:hypothetical protein